MKLGTSGEERCSVSARVWARWWAEGHASEHGSAGGPKGMLAGAGGKPRGGLRARKSWRAGRARR
ncbi:unnamed protein product [Spirodela intermedia]|uniref:Uncharacterized protein n=1 Tax=Spirodela intermedia TaxID=51605 RepID=A0A7I8IKX5_SPIIN|nr:unnamed protein product [Spirodela intermedia]CAA6658545.1 unnamed protein product [Spirodela intermedia]